LDLNRGDLVVIVGPGEMGKPRPAVVVQSDLLGPRDTIIICPLSSEVNRAGHIRPAVVPTSGNGLVAASQVMVERVAAINTSRIRRRIGHLSAVEMREIDRALMIVLGLESSETPSA
jgi:mRNA interferase MazF